MEQSHVDEDTTSTKDGTEVRSSTKDGKEVRSSESDAETCTTSSVTEINCKDMEQSQDVEQSQADEDISSTKDGTEFRCSTKDGKEVQSSGSDAETCTTSSATEINRQQKEQSQADEDTTLTKDGTEVQSSGSDAETCTTSSAAEDNHQHKDQSQDMGHSHAGEDATPTKDGTEVRSSPKDWTVVRSSGSDAETCTTSSAAEVNRQDKEQSQDMDQSHTDEETTSTKDGTEFRNSTNDGTEVRSTGSNAETCTTSFATEINHLTEQMANSDMYDGLDECESSGSFSHVGISVSDLISFRLTALHHVIQDIRYRLGNQLQDPQEDNQGCKICKCGKDDCIDLCDIKQGLENSVLVPEMWALVQQLEESYLTLGEAYKEDHQLDQALKVVKIPCLLDDSIGSTYLFLPKAWTLVGDVHTEYYMTAWAKSPTNSQISNEVDGDMHTVAASRFEKVPATAANAGGFEPYSKVASELRSGNILEFLGIPKFDNAEDHLLAAIDCYEESRKAIGVDESAEFIYVVMKKSIFVWVQLGSYRLANSDYSGAGIAFANAGKSLEEVSDHKTRGEVFYALGDFISSFVEKIRNEFKTLPTFPAAHLQGLKLFSSLYLEAREFYENSLEELQQLPEECDNICKRLDILKENMDQIKHEMSLFPHKSTCLEALDLGRKKIKRSYKGNNRQKVKSLDFSAKEHQGDSRAAYSPKTDPVMYLKVLLQLSDFSWSLSNLSNMLDSNRMQRTALEILLSGRHVAEANGDSELFQDRDVEDAFWTQLRLVLKTMLSRSRDGDGKSSQEYKTLYEMYDMSLKSPMLGKLHDMDTLWSSSKSAA